MVALGKRLKQTFKRATKEQFLVYRQHQEYKRMNSTNRQEFEELTIDSLNGLQAFLRNAQAQYNAGLTLEAELLTTVSREQVDDLYVAFQAVRRTVTQLQSAIQNGTQVTNEDAVRLQRQYDELIQVVATLKRLVDRQTLTHTEMSPAQPAEPPAPHQVKAPAPQSHSPVDIETVITRKPKTGALTIASDDGALIDIKDRVSCKSTGNKKDASKKQTNKQLPNEDTSAGHAKKLPKSVRKKIFNIIEHSQRRYTSLQKRYPAPTTVQQLLLEEAREGIEHLELLAKQSRHTQPPTSAVAEVASHIRYALEAVEEEGAQTKGNTPPTEVPVVTESAGHTNTARQQEGNRRPSSAVSFVPTSVTTKKPTMARRTIPQALQTLPKPSDIYELESLTEKYLTAPRYQQHILSHYSSLQAFEQLLDATITKVEATTIDAIEKWLGDLPASAFAFVKDMSIPELEAFANRSFADVNADLQKQNIKYETFVVWRDMVDDMVPVVRGGRAMRFGELFAHWMVELDMQSE
jgi:hypothetical protein